MLGLCEESYTVQCNNNYILSAFSFAQYCLKCMVGFRYMPGWSEALKLRYPVLLGIDKSH